MPAPSLRWQELEAELAEIERDVAVLGKASSVRVVTAAGGGCGGSG